MKIYKPKIDNKHQDSFWYNGQIAETDKAELFATGEIKLNCNHKPTDDKELSECYKNDHFSLNNWYELYDKETDEYFALDADTYDEAIEQLKLNEK